MSDERLGTCDNKLHDPRPHRVLSGWSGCVNWRESAQPPQPRICGNCGLPLAPAETEEMCREIFGDKRGAAPASELTAEQLARKIANDTFTEHNPGFVESWIKQISPMLEAYAHAVRQAQEKLCTHDAMCPVCCRPCVVNEEIRPFKSLWNRRETFEHWYGNRPTNRREVSWEVWQAAAHAVRQQAERDIETLKRVLNDARKSFGRNGTIEFDHLESQIAKLTAERERLNEQVVQLCGDVKAIAGDYTDAVTAKRRAESALGEARGLILDEARARVLLTVRDWPGVGTSKLNELDDAILALKAEDK